MTEELRSTPELPVPDWSKNTMSKNIGRTAQYPPWPLHDWSRAKMTEELRSTPPPVGCMDLRVGGSASTTDGEVSNTGGAIQRLSDGRRCVPTRRTRPSAPRQEAPRAARRCVHTCILRVTRASKVTPTVENDETTIAECGKPRGDVVRAASTP